MWLLITALLWVGVSVPLALFAGRALRSMRRSLADEVEDFLRGRSPVRTRLALSGALVLGACITAGTVVIGQAAAQQLPAARLAATQEIQRLMGATTTTTTAEPSGARRRPVAATSGPRIDAPSDDGGADRRDPSVPATTVSTGTETRASTATVEPDVERPGTDERGRAERRRRDRDRERDDERSRSTTSTTAFPPTTTAASAPTAGPAPTAPGGEEREVPKGDSRR